MILMRAIAQLIAQLPEFIGSRIDLEEISRIYGYNPEKWAAQKTQKSAV
ncbi:hypothetical protein [Planktothricoides raciborskii]|uniref:Uncharacterized protein n=1 Tax=Planktothricoides raciborskii GIHE-MW2 TaxID=2792601 RepID=A0AAU8JB76_9CYAN